MMSKELKLAAEQYSALPTMTPYPPAYISPKVILESRSRKYPHGQRRQTTAKEMLKPHTSSLGVIPIRSSSDIPSLRLVIEGVQASIDGLQQMEVPKLYTSPATSFVIPELSLDNETSEREHENINEKHTKERKRKELKTMEKRQEEQPPKKPAILSKIGTTVAAKFSEREKVEPKPSYLHHLHKKARPVKITSRPSTAERSHSSLLSGDIEDSSEDHYPEDVETAVTITMRVNSQSSKDGSVMSAEDLLEEAKRISSAGSERRFHQQKTVDEKASDSSIGRTIIKGKKSSKASKTSKSEKKLHGQGRDRDAKVNEGEFEEAAGVKRGERTVDEIIASLRDQSAYNIETEADRKIKEIMDKIMSRTNAKLGLDEKTGEATYPLETEADEMFTTVDIEGHTSIADLEPLTPETFDLLVQREESSQLDSNEVISLDRETTNVTEVSEIKEFTETVPSCTGELADEQEITKEQEDIFSGRDWEEQVIQLPTIQQAWEDLLAPTEATLEDLISIQGEKMDIQECKTQDLKIPARKTVSSFSLLSTWTPKKSVVKSEVTKNIHHFCCMTMDYQLPKSLMHVGRKYHTPDRFPSVMPDQPYRFKPGELTPLMEGDTCSYWNNIQTEEASIPTQNSNKTIVPGNAFPSTLQEWQQKANSLLGEIDISVFGEKLEIKTDETQVYWSPAPPKLGAAPHKVRERLFPQYYLDELDEFGQLKSLSQRISESDSSDEEKEDMISLEDLAARGRTLMKRHNSAEFLTNISKEIVQEKSKTVTTIDKNSDEISVHKLAGQICQDSQTDSVITRQQVIVHKRPQSAQGTFVRDGALAAPQDFSTALLEIRQQKKLLDKAKKQQQSEDISCALEETETLKPEITTKLQEDDILTVTNKAKSITEKVKKELTLAEEAIQAGRTYVILPKKKKINRHVKKMDTAKMEALMKILMTEPTKKLLRQDSMPNLNKIIERELRVPWKIRSYRPSLPDLLNFEEYKTRKRMPVEEDEREWVRDIWNKWFDAVFPPTPEESDEDDAESQDREIDEKIDEPSHNANVITGILSQDIIEIEPITDTPENKNLYQLFSEEINKLSAAKEGSLTAFDYCRRGALYRKIGQLKKAEADLDRSIEMEPELLDAYWHRHLLYILQDRKASAVEDLNFILKKNKQHSGAYRSLAEISKLQNDTTMAIVNYTSAIKFNPLDHEAYFQRAQMYEQRGDILLAMEDYAKAMRIMPSRTDIVMKHGIYCFENENWQNAISDFTKLLKVDPLSSAAHVYRGQAYVKMSNWVPAVQDFSAAIHLDPQNWQAFFMRACVLRKTHPKRALQDLSISLMLNDSEKNILAFLHRGILYNSQGNSDDAIADFKSALKLNKNLAVAHCNLGLIYLTKQSNFNRAIEKFTSAIIVDPTYLRAYICRAEAYHKIHQVKKALRDITRAIHMKPDVHNYYMYRGRLLLELGNLELAAFCVYHASEMGMDNPSSTFGGLPSQQAVVQSFLKNYDKAIDVLSQAIQSKPIAPYYLLLGKTHMKAHQFLEAATNFKEALEKMKPWTAKETWPPEAADAQFLTGLCCMELNNYSEALQHFNAAIKLNSSYADAYYNRGLASLKLKQSKGILDFNRALALNPKMFQAYLSRACYYGMRGKHAKAILNCNEAIKLQPKSIRAYLYRGALKFQIKAYELAVLDLTKASSIDGHCPLPYFNRAVCYHEIGQFGSALTDYSIVLLLGDMLQLEVLINRGLLYFEIHDYMNALSDFQAAAIMNPNDHKILHTLGLCYHKLNRLNEAVGAFTKCVKLKPFFFDGFIARGNTFMDFSKDIGLKLAKRDYQRVLRLDPLYLPARINMAYAAQMSGKLMQAWKHFTSIIEVKPSYKPALEGRAIVNLQMNNTFGAFQDISQSINYGPTAELLTNRGVISQFMGDRVMAMADYQRAIRLDYGYSLAYFNAGNVYFHTRHFRQALDYYNKAIKCNPRDDSALLNRAITKVLLHDTKGALADFEMAAHLSPHSAHIFFNRANLYASLEQFDLAEREYNKALKLKPDDPLMLKRRADARSKLGRQKEAIDDYRRAIDIQERPHKLVVKT